MPTTEGIFLPFDEAIEFFRDKLTLSTERWNELQGAEHDHAFTTAGATSAQLLQEIRQQVDRAIADGISFGEFKKQFSEIADRLGWNHRGGRDWRADIIYRQNLYQAYAAGRYQQQRDPDLLKLRPYWRYRHGGSREPRPTHIALDGKVFPADSPWWDEWYPPNGFGCRCFVQSLSQRDLDREGLTVEQPPDGDTMEVFDITTNQVRNLRNSPDPGFDYAPGQSVVQGRRDEVLGTILGKLDPDLKGQVEQFINTPSTEERPEAEPPPPGRDSLPPEIQITERDSGSIEYLFELDSTDDDGNPNWVEVAVRKWHTGNLEVDFTVNGEFTTEDIAIDAADSSLITARIGEIFRADVASRPDGSEFITSPARGDGRAKFRETMYARAGFSFLDGEYQRGIVRNGRLVPANSNGDLFDEDELKEHQAAIKAQMRGAIVEANIAEIERFIITQRDFQSGIEEFEKAVETAKEALAAGDFKSAKAAKPRSC